MLAAYRVCVRWSDGSANGVVRGVRDLSASRRSVRPAARASIVKNRGVLNIRRRIKNARQSNTQGMGLRVTQVCGKAAPGWKAVGREKQLPKRK